LIAKVPTMMRITRRQRWWAAGVLLLAQGAALAVSCSLTVGEQACFDLASALGAVQQYRCGGGDAGFQQGYQNTIDIAANGNCANITSVRDQDELTNACIPCLLDASCGDTAALCAGPADASLPPACVGQLQL
jgi:hypothetical protein